MDKKTEIGEAFEAELQRWAKYQSCSDAQLAELDPRMRDLVTKALFCPPAYQGFVSERVEAAVEDDDDAMDLLEEMIEQVVEEAAGDDAVNSDSFYDETGSIPLVSVLQEASETGNLSTEMLLAMAQHSCMMVRGSLGQQRGMDPENLQEIDANALLEGLRPLLKSSQSIEALAAADLMLRLGAEISEVHATWETWEASERMNLAFLMINLHDSETGYEYLGGLVGAEGFEDVAWELRELATDKALSVLLRAQEQVHGEMISNYVCHVACGNAPGVADALKTLAESPSAEMRQEAQDWQVRIQQRDAGIEEWVTLPSADVSLPEGVIDQGDEHPIAKSGLSDSSPCVVCQEPIAKTAMRLGVLRMVDTETISGRATAWLHPECWEGCAELQSIDDLDARLRETSPDTWVESQFPLFGLVAPSEWTDFTNWLEEQEGACDHDEESYSEWFSGKVSGDALAQKSERLYEAMGTIAGTGSCACAAAEGVMLYPAPHFS